MSLDHLRDADGTFAILAIDHRDSLRVVLNAAAPDVVTAAEITGFKRDLVNQLAARATGVMLEPEYSIPQVSALLPPGVGFTAALEAQGYLDDPGAEPTRLLDGWSVAAAAACGAAAAKLLVPYHPGHRLAGAQERVAAAVTAECREIGLPLLLEPLFFGLKTPAERSEVVATTARRFAAIGPDILKLPFPSHAAAASSARRAACAAVSAECPMPWVLLSGGGTFDDFAGQLSDAVAEGCAGFTVGRALWAEAASAHPADRRDLIADIVAPRFERLREIAAAR